MAAESSIVVRRIGRAGPTAGELDLLRAATLPADRAVPAWDRWRHANVIDDAHHRSTDLLPAVCANLPSDALGPDADRLRGLRRRVWADTQFRNQVIPAAAELLEPLEVVPLLAKGAALASTVYPEPGIRPMADVDIVVGDDHFDAAIDRFVAAGWHRPREVESPFDHAMEVIDPLGRPIDVHRWVLYPRFARVPEVTWLDRSVELDRGRLRRFRTADELVLGVLHGLLTNSQSSVRWPLDVVHIARHGPAADGVDPATFWDEVVASATGIGAGPIVADAIDLCRVEFDADVPLDAVTRAAGSPLDSHLATHWALSRRGLKLEWRVRRYRRLRHQAGRRASISGYVGPRVAAARAKGWRQTVDVRVRRMQQIVDVRRRA